MTNEAQTSTLNCISFTVSRKSRHGQKLDLIFYLLRTKFLPQLTRVRKTSSNKKEAARHTYTEPGTHLEDEHSETPLRQRSRLVTVSPRQRVL